MEASRRLAAVVVAIVALQFVVPAIALVLPDKPNRLGWQMFSGMGEDAVTVVDQDGEVIVVPWDDVLARARRPELDWTQYLPERLCQHTEAQELTVTVGVDARTVTC